MELLFFFATGKFTYIHMDFYMTSYSKCSASSVPVLTANDKDLPISTHPPQTWLYLWERPGDCCTPVSLKEEFLVNMVFWKPACLFMASSEDRLKGHTDFWLWT